MIAGVFHFSKIKISCSIRFILFCLIPSPLNFCPIKQKITSHLYSYFMLMLKQSRISVEYLCVCVCVCVCVFVLFSGWFILFYYNTDIILVATRSVIYLSCNLKSFFFFFFFFLLFINQFGSPNFSSLQYLATTHR